MASPRVRLGVSLAGGVGTPCGALAICGGSLVPALLSGLSTADGSAGAPSAFDARSAFASGSKATTAISSFCGRPRSRTLSDEPEGLPLRQLSSHRQEAAGQRPPAHTTRLGAGRASYETVVGWRESGRRGFRDARSMRRSGRLARSAANPAVHELPQPASRAREASDQAGFLSPHHAPVERGLTAVKARSSDLRTRGLLSYRGRNTLRDALSLPREGMRCDDRNHARGSSGGEYERPLPRDHEPPPPRLMRVAGWTFRRGSNALDRLQIHNPSPFVQHGSPTALTLGPSSGGQHPQFEGTIESIRMRLARSAWCSPGPLCAGTAASSRHGASTVGDRGF